MNSEDEPSDPANPPTVSCSSCNREWELDYELDELHAGNSAVEQFALDHFRHTGHYPDEVTPWVTECGMCPMGERFLSREPALRWAETHARHTRHSVELRHRGSDSETVETVEGG